MGRHARKTRIIATLGPASSSPETIGRLLEAGVNLFRLNFSHGSLEAKEQSIRDIRETAARLDRTVAILADLQGPKIRTGRMEQGAIQLVKGATLEIVTHELLGTPERISTVYTALPDDVRPGARILLDDGLIELRVQEVVDRTVRCTVVEGGILKDLKGINLPGVAVSSPSLTDKDRRDLEFCLPRGIDYLALSFVRTAQDVEAVKTVMRERGTVIPIIAKIEKPEALRNFRAILRAADGIMVARGDLGVEVSAEKVPLYQKKIIRACNEAGKPVITATQMLESMITHPRPTRAETSDVANAILDGTDAVMLSGETASGQFPVEAVRVMVKVAADVERAELFRLPPRLPGRTFNSAEAVAEAACHAAATLKAKALVVFTQSGSTAALVSRYRPSQPIIAFTPDPAIQRRLALRWGVSTILVGAMDGTDQQIAEVEGTLLASGFRRGDLVIITMGVPLAMRGSTNLIKVHKLGVREFYEVF